MPPTTTIPIITTPNEQQNSPTAVGLGNIWRFPFEAGVHGGGAFLILYVICVLLIGVPVVVAEFVLGRGTHANAKGAINVNKYRKKR